MIDSAPLNQQKRTRRARSSETMAARLEGWKYIGSLLLTFGLAAAITGGFGVVGNFVTGRQRVEEQRCSIAEQIVLDETASSALSEVQRSRLNALAMSRIEQCMGTTG